MKTLIQKSLIIALSSVGILAFSQTETDKKNMKTETDTVALKKLSEMLQKKKTSKEQLQKKAKELGIPYSGTNTDGSFFELQGFEPNDTPIYYTTYQTPSIGNPNREMPLQEKIKNAEKPTSTREKTCTTKRKKKK